MREAMEQLLREAIIRLKPPSIHNGQVAPDISLSK